MHPKFTTHLLLLGLALILGLTACGAPLAAASPAPKVSSAPAKDKYTAQDALAVWQAHGLTATLGATGGPPPAGFTADYVVSPALGRGGAMLLAVAPSAAFAEASLNQFGHGPFYSRVWRQGNLILRYSDDTAQPYIQALADLR